MPEDKETDLTTPVGLYAVLHNQKELMSMYLDRAVRPASLRRELPETAQGERLKVPQNPILIEPRNPVSLVNLGL